MKLDILAFAAHPDDVELGCSGTLLKHVHFGKKVGVVDLTQGELGTNGDIFKRQSEAKNASSLLQLSIRHNMKFKDGFFSNDKVHQIEVIKIIRKYQPAVVLANAIADRHPDHSRAASLIKDACFLSGLVKIKTKFDGKDQKAWRPKALFHYIQDTYLQPDFVVDVSKFWEMKIKSIQAYQSQFYQPESKQKKTHISTKEFWEFIIARAKEFGHSIGVNYGEGFQTAQQVSVNNFFDVI